MPPLLRCEGRRAGLSVKWRVMEGNTGLFVPMKWSRSARTTSDRREFRHLEV